MRLRLLLPCFVGLAALGGGCGDDGGDGGGDGRPVAVRFEGLVDGQPAACGQTYAGLGTSGSDYTLGDYRLYVSNVRLLAGGREVPVALDQDGEWQRGALALLDFEDGSTGCDAGNPGQNDAVRGTVAEAGPFDGVRFDVGVPFDDNHQDASAAAPPLDLTAMFWSWQGGYKFIRVDGETEVPFFLHLGSTGCDGNDLTGGTTACTRPNRMNVELTGFDPDVDTIAVDVADVFAGSDMSQSAGAPGCMSGVDDPECPAVFARLGLPMDGPAPGPQQLFSVAPAPVR